MTQDEKKKFRASKKWKDFRLAFIKKVNNIDFLTNRKAPKGSNLHHCSNVYDDLNLNNFYLLGYTSHKVIHHIYRIYKKDKKVIDRLVEILNKMEENNF